MEAKRQKKILIKGRKRREYTKRGEANEEGEERMVTGPYAV